MGKTVGLGTVKSKQVKVTVLGLVSSVCVVVKPMARFGIADIALGVMAHFNERRCTGQCRLRQTAALLCIPQLH